MSRSNRSLTDLARGLLLSATAFALLTPAQVKAQGLASDSVAHSLGTWGVDLGDQDRTVRPGDDFYRYQNGGWLARSELGPQQNIDAYWRDVRLRPPAQLIQLLNRAAADHGLSPESPAGKAGALYRAAVNRDAVEARGLAPLQPELQSIRSARSRSDIARLMGEAEGPGAIRSSSLNFPLMRGLFVVNIAQDHEHPERYAVYLGQGGILLPGPEYYSDPKLADIKAAYQAYVANILTLIDWPEPERRAREIVDFETRVAAVSWSHEQMQDVVRTYNPMTVRELERSAPGFDWNAYLHGADLTGVQHVVVDAKSAFGPIAEVFAGTDLDVLKARLAFAEAEYNATQLPSALFSARFAFRIDQLRQSLQARDPQRVAERTVESAIPDALTAMYVAEYSSPVVKAKVEEMASRLKTAFDLRLQTVSWMSPQTRAKARAKLAGMRIKVGYPDKLQTYPGLQMREDDLYGDVQRAAAYNWRRQVARLNRPFERSEWILTAQYPNYNYDPQTNSVEITASLLQPPFFDPKADEAVNYGAAGTLLGQVIAAAFDNQGSRFDADGRLAPQWTAGEDAAYAAMAGKIVDRYSAVEVLPGLHAKGELLVNEAVADLGGIQMALDGYHASLGGRAAPVLDGYTGDQRFFLGRAQSWRAKFSVPATRNQIATGSNAIPWMRVDLTLPNIDAWYDAFDVKSGDRMYLAPADRVRIW